MELNYLLALRRRWPSLVALTLLGALAGLGALLLTPRTYASEVEFYVSTPDVPGTSAQASGQFAQGRVTSYVQLLSSERMARQVVDKTGVPLSASAVASRIEATTEIDTVVITATVTDHSRQQALLIAQGLVDTFPALVDELDNSPRKLPVVTINTISGPSVSSKPVSPNPVVYLGAGLAAGLLLGVALAVLREVADTSVRSDEVARSLSGAPLLASIPFDRDARRAPLVGERSNGRAEAIRQLRTNLRFIEATQAGNVALVTSTEPGESKTLVAVNLAASFAELGERVLLIDGHLRDPQLNDLFGASPELGLSNVLAGQLELEDAIRTSEAHRVDYLGGGSQPPNPAELLASDRMRQVIASARSRYDRVIIDGAPLLSITDGVVTSALADVVILVLRYGHTPRNSAALAVQNLKQVNVRTDGVILNMTRAGRERRLRRRRDRPQHVGWDDERWEETKAMATEAEHRPAVAATPVKEPAPRR